MSTIHNIHGDLAAGASPLAATDEVAIYEASTGLAKRLAGTLVVAGVIAPVATTAGATALTLSALSHGNRTVVLNNTSPIAVTLPTASGSGAKFRIFINAAATATASTIKVGNSTDVMRGIVLAFTTSSAALTWVATATDDSISLNGGTKGGFVGDYYEFTDVASGVYSMHGVANSSGATATPLSSAV